MMAVDPQIASDAAGKLQWQIDLLLLCTTWKVARAICLLLELSRMLTCSNFSAGHTPLSELPAARDLCTHNHLHSFSADTIVYGDPCSRVIRAVASRKKFTRCDLSATSCLFLCLGSFTTVACVVVRVTSLLLYHYR